MMAGSPCEKSTYAIHRPADLRRERVNILKAGDLSGMEFTAAGTTYHIRMPGSTTSTTLWRWWRWWALYGPHLRVGGGPQLCDGAGPVRGAAG